MNRIWNDDEHRFVWSTEKWYDKALIVIGWITVIWWAVYLFFFFMLLLAGEV